MILWFLVAFVLFFFGGVMILTSVEIFNAPLDELRVEPDQPDWSVKTGQGLARVVVCVFGSLLLTLAYVTAKFSLGL